MTPPSGDHTYPVPPPPRRDRAAAAANIAWALERDRLERRQAAQRPATVAELEDVRRDLARLAAVADCDHGDQVARLTAHVSRLEGTLAELVSALEAARIVELTASGGIVPVAEDAA